VRDLCRTRGDMVEDLTRARNRLGKFLLRHGRVWRGGSTWTLKHQAWLGSQRFEQPAMAQTFGHYLAVVEVRNAQLDAVEADLAGWCDRPPFDWQVARLAAYRGITRLGALTLAAEVADWRRFATASQFMGFVGWSQARTPAAQASTAAGSPRLATPTCVPSWSRRPGPTSTAPPSACRSPAASRACHHRSPPERGQPAALVRPVPGPGRPQERQEHRGGRDRPGARRVLVGRDDRLTQISSGSPLEIGRGGEHDSYDAPGRRRCRTDPRTNYAVACARRP
jgi:transposase